ncbi:hypothetical protein KAZ82_01050 [Candidatus Babeliales bacterium]|nr:hypothetical protein [Candidatus Babeliales bacterium]
MNVLKKLSCLISILATFAGCDWCGCCKQQPCNPTSQNTPTKTDSDSQVPVAKMPTPKSTVSQEHMLPETITKAVIPPMPSAPKNV